MKILTIDIETTGIPSKGADYKIHFMDYPRILSIAWKLNDMPTVEYIVAQYGVPIPPEATAINGITDEMSNNSPHSLEGLLIEIMDLGNIDFIIGHNIYFDTSIIKANILRLQKEGRITDNPYNVFEQILHKDKRIDTMRAGQKLCGGKWPKLTELYFKLFNENYEAHSAGNDVDACHRCYLELIKLGVIKLPVIIEEEV